MASCRISWLSRENESHWKSFVKPRSCKGEQWRCNSFGWPSNACSILIYSALCTMSFGSMCMHSSLLYVPPKTQYLFELKKYMSYIGMNISTSLLRKPRLKEIKQFAPSHPARKWTEMEFVNLRSGALERTPWCFPGQSSGTWTQPCLFKQKCMNSLHPFPPLYLASVRNPEGGGMRSQVSHTQSHWSQWE